MPGELAVLDEWGFASQRSRPERRRNGDHSVERQIPTRPWWIYKLMRISNADEIAMQYFHDSLVMSWMLILNGESIEKDNYKQNNQLSISAPMHRKTRNRNTYIDVKQVNTKDWWGQRLLACVWDESDNFGVKPDTVSRLENRITTAGNGP